MVDYKKMYTKLFNEVTDIIEKLRLVQMQTENMYIEGEGCDPEIDQLEMKDVESVKDL